MLALFWTGSNVEIVGQGKNVAKVARVYDLKCMVLFLVGSCFQ